MLALSGITKIYKSGGRQIYALRDVGMKVREGEFLAVTGRSGCGKSTLLHVISGLVRPTGGTVDYNGEDITAKGREELLRFRREHVGIILQNFSLLNDRTVYANVELPLKIRKVNTGKRREMVREYLDKMDMGDMLDRYPQQLSGGQQQRVAIARALIGDAELILADEPTGSLDEENAEQVIGILRGIARSGRTVIMVTHDMDAAQQCDRRIILDGGRVI